jgi:hypothetical protein
LILAVGAAAFAVASERILAGRLPNRLPAARFAVWLQIEVLAGRDSPWRGPEEARRSQIRN